MTYNKTIWEDRVSEYPNRYVDQDGNQYTFTRDNGTVSTAGTVVNADRMNNIEDGIEEIVENINTYNEDSGWQTATLDSQFTVYSENTPVQYRKIGKMVEIRGAVAPTSDIAGSTTRYVIFTLPSEYRHSYPSIIDTLCQGSTQNKWLLGVDSSGNVTFSRYGTTSGYVTCTTSNWLPFHVMFFVD